MTISRTKWLAQAAPVILGLTLITSVAHGDPRDSIVLDPATGNYTITYAEPGETNVYRMLFIPATKIDPSVQSSFKRDNNMSIIYRYQITNGKASKQYLRHICIDPASNIIADQPLPLSFGEGANKSDDELLAEFKAGQRAVASPSGWKGSAAPSRKYGLRLCWSPLNSQINVDNGLKPAGNMSGLGFASRDLPGIGDMQLRGHTRYPKNSDYDTDEMLEPTSEVGKQYQAMTLNNFVRRPAAVPTIAVPVPFNATVLVERIQAHTHTWVAKKLLDAAFAAQLDRYFQAAINSYRLNQPKSGNQQLQAMRELIKQEHADSDKEEHGDDKDDRDDKHNKHNKHNKGDDRDKHKTKRGQIDQLAARVLDFDLKYVMKRMGGDD